MGSPRAAPASLFTRANALLLPLSTLLMPARLLLTAACATILAHCCCRAACWIARLLLCAYLFFAARRMYIRENARTAAALRICLTGGTAYCHSIYFSLRVLPRVRTGYHYARAAAAHAVTPSPPRARRHYLLSRADCITRLASSRMPQVLPHSVPHICALLLCCRAATFIVRSCITRRRARHMYVFLASGLACARLFSPSSRARFCCIGCLRAARKQRMLARTIFAFTHAPPAVSYTPRALRRFGTHGISLLLAHIAFLVLGSLTAQRRIKHACCRFCTHARADI